MRNKYFNRAHQRVAENSFLVCSRVRQTFERTVSCASTTRRRTRSRGGHPRRRPPSDANSREFESIPQKELKRWAPIPRTTSTTRVLPLDLFAARRRGTRNNTQIQKTTSTCAHWENSFSLAARRRRPPNTAAPRRSPTLDLRRANIAPRNPAESPRRGFSSHTSRSTSDQRSRTTPPPRAPFSPPDSTSSAPRARNTAARETRRRAPSPSAPCSLRAGTNTSTSIRAV